MMTWGAPTLFRKVTAQEGNRSNQIGLMRRSVSAFALLSFGAGVAVQRPGILVEAPCSCSPCVSCFQTC